MLNLEDFNKKAQEIYDNDVVPQIKRAAANLADPNICKTDNWIAGAQWQQERMYSEEDMKKAFQSSSHTNMLDIYNSFEDFIEQFKNK